MDRLRLWACLSMLPVLCLMLVANAVAAPVGYTQQSAFIAAVPETPTTLNFDSAAANSLIPSGSALDGIAFSYSFEGVSLKVSTVNDTAYSTTSGAHFLGTDDADILQDGDDIALSFVASSSIGLYIISNDDLIDNDVVLVAGGTSVGIAAADIQTTLPDGSKVYFLGINDSAGAFSSANLMTAGNGEFLFNIDDIITVVAPDADGDAVPDVIDNCPIVPNGAGQLDPDDAGVAQRNTDGDPQGDACDADDDNDALTDLEEAVLGTARLNSDSDADGVSDGAEVANGTNPLVADNCDIDSTTGPSVGDRLLLQQHLAGQVTLNSPQQIECDMYPDGKLTISDQLQLENLLTAP